MWDRLKLWARRLRNDTLALYFCARHPATPRLAKVFALSIAAYALSPIDLIPDFIPVLGFLDELILLPGAIWLCLKLIPPPVVAECRARAQAWFADRRAKPSSRVGAAVILCIWIAVIWFAAAALLG